MKPCRPKTTRNVATLLASIALVGCATAAQPKTATTAPTSKPSRMVRAWLKPGAEHDNATRLLSDLTDFSPTPTKLDAYGGDTRVKLKATGFFRTEKVGDRWWMVDPDGYRYFNDAVNSVSPGVGSPVVEAAFRSKFGSPREWAKQTIALLKANGFNSVGSWSDDANLSVAPDRIPYTPMLNFMSSFASSRGATQGTGHTAYPYDLIPAFDPDFPAHCDARARDLVAKRKDDPYLVGYFSDNELPFNKGWLDRYLTLPEGDAGRLAADAFIKERNLTAATLTDAARDEWLGVVADRYFSTVSQAIRKYDPNHMYIGCRFHGADHRSDALFTVAGKYVDVISYNLYGVWTPSTPNLTRWSTLAGKPIAITEWYAKGMDSGMPNITGAGWTVGTQRERGMFYQNFVLGLIESKVVVGFHWFKYADNDPDNRKTDPSNRDSNKGIITRDFKTYDELLTPMKELNAVIYPLADYFDAKK